jgi:hypothetical protein
VKLKISAWKPTALVDRPNKRARLPQQYYCFRLIPHIYYPSPLSFTSYLVNLIRLVGNLRVFRLRVSLQLSRLILKLTERALRDERRAFPDQFTTAQSGNTRIHHI